MLNKCSKCAQQFNDGDHVLFTGTSVYHTILMPRKNSLQFALERPHLFTNVEHLICEEKN
jgi:hypothetical protein